MPHRRLGHGLAVVLASSLTVLVTTVAGAAPSDAAPKRVSVPDTRPTWAVPARATGTPAATDRVSVRVLLKLRDAAAAERLAVQVSTPGSGSYGHYLTPAAFRARFAPRDGDVTQVRSFLSGAGLSVGATSAGNRWVSASGTVAQLGSAFHVSFRTYSYQGRRLRAPSADATLPASVADVVSTVTGLSQPASLRTPQTRTVVPERPASGVQRRSTAPGATRPTPSTCSDYWGQHSQTLPQAYGRTRFNTYICGYRPDQLRQAYGTSSAVRHGTTGRGVTVAIIDAYASPTMEADANAYARLVGDPTFRSGQYTETVFRPFTLQDECAGEAAWNGEETLDVEAVHAMAPGAKIHYVGAANCDAGIDDALNYVVQNRTADIVSNSYGNRGEQVAPAEVALEHSIFVQAAVEGMGMYFSSGDSGDEVVNGLTPQPDYPASDPLVTGVGGTSLLLDRRNRTVLETGWETSIDPVDYTGATAVYSEPLPGEFVFGAGGGASTLFRQPWYQRGVVPTSLATRGRTQKMRVSPDIAAVADPYTGFSIGQTVAGAFTVSSIGGTSLAAPLVAGIQALASQGRARPIGFANPLLYALPAAAFHDTVHHDPHFASVSGGYLGSFDTGSTQVTRRGYDDTTGRGTPNGPVLLRLEASVRR